MTIEELQTLPSDTLIARDAREWLELIQNQVNLVQKKLDASDTLLGEHVRAGRRLQTLLDAETAENTRLTGENKHMLEVLSKVEPALKVKGVEIAQLKEQLVQHLQEVPVDNKGIPYLESVLELPEVKGVVGNLQQAIAAIRSDGAAPTPDLWFAFRRVLRAGYTCWGNLLVRFQDELETEKIYTARARELHENAKKEQDDLTVSCGNLKREVEEARAELQKTKEVSQSEQAAYTALWKPVMDVIQADKTRHAGTSIPSVVLTRLKEWVEYTKAQVDELEMLKKEWNGDKPLPEDAAIEACHPMNSEEPHVFQCYEKAMRLVGARQHRGYHGHVNLVHWLLMQLQQNKPK